MYHDRIRLLLLEMLNLGAVPAGDLVVVLLPHALAC
jgi:hypothetical protein